MALMFACVFEIPSGEKRDAETFVPLPKSTMTSFSAEEPIAHVDSIDPTRRNPMARLHLSMDTSSVDAHYTTSPSKDTKGSEVDSSQQSKASQAASLSLSESSSSKVTVLETVSCLCFICLTLLSPLSLSLSLSL